MSRPSSSPPRRLTQSYIRRRAEPGSDDVVERARTRKTLPYLGSLSADEQPLPRVTLPMLLAALLESAERESGQSTAEPELAESVDGRYCIIRGVEKKPA